MQGKELLLLVDNISNEKNIRREDVFGVIERALEVATRKKLGKNENIRVIINPETGEYQTFKLNLKNDDLLYEYESISDIPDENFEFAPVHNIELDRVAVQVAKQALHQRLNDVEKNTQAQNMMHKVNSILTLKVTKANEKYYILANSEELTFILNKDQVIPGESFRIGDRVKVLLHEIKTYKRGNSFLVSRITDNFLKELMRFEVPEISEGIIQIKAVARIPGVRAKVAVKSNDKRIDPIGACIGIRGSRVQSISNTLLGEKIDILEWNEDLAQLVVNAMAPVKVSSVVIKETNGRREVGVLINDEQYSQGIGRNGVNITLIEKLLNCEINLISETEDKLSIDNAIKNFAYFLDINEDLAKEIMDLEFDNFETIAGLTPEDFTMIVDDIDSEMAMKIITKARLNITNSPFLKLKVLTPQILQEMFVNNLDNIDKLADLSKDELLELMPTMDEQIAEELVYDARKLLGMI